MKKIIIGLMIFALLSIRINDFVYAMKRVALEAGLVDCDKQAVIHDVLNKYKDQEIDTPEKAYEIIKCLMLKDIEYNVISRILKDLNVDVNLENICSWSTMLHIAASKGNLKCIEFLLKSGAAVNIQDATGKTPLHWACMNNHADCIDVLLQAGADVRLFDETGQTALEWTVDFKYEECVQKLVSFYIDKRISFPEGLLPKLEVMGINFVVSFYLKMFINPESNPEVIKYWCLLL